MAVIRRLALRPAPRHLAQRSAPARHWALQLTQPRALQLSAPPRALQQAPPRALQQAPPRALQQAPPRALQLTRPRALQQAPPRALQLTRPRALQLTRPRALQLTRPRALQLTRPEPSSGCACDVGPSPASAVAARTRSASERSMAGSSIISSPTPHRRTLFSSRKSIAPAAFTSRCKKSSSASLLSEVRPSFLSARRNSTFDTNPSTSASHSLNRSRSRCAWMRSASCRCESCAAMIRNLRGAPSAPPGRRTYVLL